jgi:hypothetical protein
VFRVERDQMISALAPDRPDQALMPLPPLPAPSAPELTRQTLRPAQDIWESPRGTFLSHCIFATYVAILDTCRDAGCDAWTALIGKSEVIASIGTREWAKVKT